MTKEELWKKLAEAEMPNFILGLDRSVEFPNNKVSHIYRWKFSEPGEPMCSRGWDKNHYYSILRNNIGKDICKVCLKHTLKELNK